MGQAIEYNWPGYTPSNQQQPIQQDISEKIQKYSDLGRVKSAIYNPQNGVIYVTNDGNDNITKDSYDKYARVINTERYQELKVLSAAGKVSDDKAAYDFVYPEFQDEMNRYYQAYKAHGAAVITSTEFPSITVTTFSNALINKQALIAKKYNLLSIPEKLNVPDSLNIVYPEYNNTTQSVRVGYKEGEAIDTAGYGSFTSTNVQLKKAGAGMAFTEEYFMRQFTMDIQALIQEKIALDFLTARYNRILTRLSALTTQTGGGDWAAYVPTNFQSTNRPLNDLNTAYTAINSDKLANADTIISNQKQFFDYLSNTWIHGVFTPSTTINSPQLNQIVPNPPGIMWANQWVINEDIAADTAMVIDHRYLTMIEGPQKTQQINTYNPDQTIFIEKQWFNVITGSTRTGWGKLINTI